MTRSLLACLTALITTFIPARALTPICGEASVDADAMARFVATVNPTFDPCIARAFIDEGKRYGLRGDIALCQAIIETGWFRFDGGTAVTPDQHNYCGLGVERTGMKGASFESVELGVRAMMQHLAAYCHRNPLPDDIIDPRFGLVSRGCAPHWQDLSNRWAMNPDYGVNILKLYNRMANFAGITPVPEADEEMPAADDTHAHAAHLPGLWD